MKMMMMLCGAMMTLKKKMPWPLALLLCVAK
jgi:hypothetical protein